MTNAQANPRETMLKSQLLTGNVLDARVLSALGLVSRERFVPEALRGAAYVDDELPLGEGRFLMEPLVFARLLSFARIQPHETVLDIGAASGYSSAVMSPLALKVVAVEESPKLALAAKAALAGHPNVTLVQAPLVQGAPSEGPYDAILIEGAVEVIPQSLSDQLCEGGRLLTIERDEAAHLSASGLGRIVEYRKLRGTLYKTPLLDAGVPLLAAFRRPAVFSL